MTEIVPMVRFLFVEAIDIDPAAAESVLAKEGAGRALNTIHDTLASLDEWTPGPIEGTLRTLPEVLDMKSKVVFQVARVAIAGATVSLPLFESMALLGRERALARLKAAQSIATP